MTGYVTGGVSDLLGGAEWMWGLNHIAVGYLGERHMHELGLLDSFSVLLCIVVYSVLLSE